LTAWCRARDSIRRVQLPHTILFLCWMSLVWRVWLTTSTGFHTCLRRCHDRTFASSCIMRPVRLSQFILRLSSVQLNLATQEQLSPPALVPVRRFRSESQRKDCANLSWLHNIAIFATGVEVAPRPCLLFIDGRGLVGFGCVRSSVMVDLSCSRIYGTKALGVWTLPARKVYRWFAWSCLRNYYLDVNIDRGGVNLGTYDMILYDFKHNSGRPTKPTNDGGQKPTDQTRETLLPLLLGIRY
jgi:hypothetical protein